MGKKHSIQWPIMALDKSSPIVSSPHIPRGSKIGSIGSKFSIEGSHRKGTKSEMFPLKNFSCSKIRRNTQIDFKPQTIKRVCAHTNLPYEQSQYTKKDHFCRVMDDKVGYKGCVPTYPNQGGLQEISRIPIQKPALFLQSASIRPNIGTIHLYKNGKVPSSYPTITGDKASSLHGRYYSMGRVQRKVPNGHSGSLESTTRPRFFNQLGKVTSDSMPKSKLARYKLGHAKRHSRFNQRICVNTRSLGRKGFEGGRHFPPRGPVSTRKMRICGASYKNVQNESSLASTDNRTVGFFRSGCQTAKTSSNSETPYMVGSNRKLNRESSFQNPIAKYDSMDRCLDGGFWGINRSGEQYLRSMEGKYDYGAHKHKGAENSTVDGRKFHHPCRIKHKIIYRQHGNKILLEKSGIKQIKGIAGNIRGNLESTNQKESVNRSKLPPWEMECYSRQAITESRFPARNENFRQRLQENCGMEGSIAGGLDGSPRESGAGAVHLPAASPEYSFLGFLPGGAQQMEPNLHIPSNRCATKCIEEVGELQGQGSVSGSVVANEPMVPDTPPDVRQADGSVGPAREGNATKEDILTLTRV